MQPDTSTRLRLVEVRTPGGTLRLGGGFACVLAAPAARSAAARWIATSVVGPRPDGADGTIEIAGRFVSVRSLPSPLLPPSSPSVLGREAMRAQWQAVWTSRRDALGAAHASRRLARHRAEAALDRARRRSTELAQRSEALVPASDTEHREAHDAAALLLRTELAQRAAHESEVQRYELDRDRRARVASLVTMLADLSPVSSQRAVALADEWEAFRSAVAMNAPLLADASRDPLVRAAEVRVAGARMQLARASGGIDPGARGQLDELHRRVIESEAEVSEAKRKGRGDALARYEMAVRLERDALSAAGIESYASFLVEIAQGAPKPDPEARARAAAELAAAEAELAIVRSDSRQRSLAPEVVEAELNLRARAAELLGRFPSDDVGSELRAVLVEHPNRPALIEQLRDELRAISGDESTDPEAEGRSYLLTPIASPPVVLAAPAAVAQIDLTVTPTSHAEERQALADDHAMLRDEVLALVQARDEHAVALDELEVELARFDLLRAADLDQLEADEVVLAVGGLLDSYRRGDLLAGRLPLVLDGALDGLSLDVRRAAILVLAAATDVQAVIVTDDPNVVDAVRETGATTLTWPETAAIVPSRFAPDSQFDRRSSARPTADAFDPIRSATPAQHATVVRAGVNGERCGVHAASASVVRCAHCAQPSCLDCVVYVLGESDLWCSACAVSVHGQRPHGVRTLRRRGA